MDLDVLTQQLDPRGDARLRECLDDVRHAVEDLAHLLGLAQPRPIAAERRIATVAEVWVSRLHDLMAARLRGYGPVDPTLGEILDPRVRELQRRLEALADAARVPPQSRQP
jgi:hypothetical protein